MNPLIALLHLFPPELAHEITLKTLPYAAPLFGTGPDDPLLSTEVFGCAFPNPLGMAAGFDKNAEVILPLLTCGFGFVEAGTVTPRPQIGNPKPRLFRLPEINGVINRMGFNNRGMERFCKNLEAAMRDIKKGRGVVGANVGKNKDSTDAVADYVSGVRAVSARADYVVVNISSPNTPGLRGLQNRDELTNLLRAVQEARADLPRRPPLLVKIAPDIDSHARRDIAEVVVAAKVDGLIVSNTTLSRPEGLSSEMAGQAGGLSGPPLRPLSNEVLKDMYRLTEGRMPLIGVGGVGSAEDAYEKIRLGASLVQLYTALVYQGPHLVGTIKKGLAALLRRDGFASVSEAVGVDAR